MGNEGFDMEIETEVETELRERVMEMVMKCSSSEDRKRKKEEESPLIWAIEIGKCIGSKGLDLPSTELGFVLVSLLSSSDFNCPPLWKFLHQSISCNLVSSLHVLSLLAPRVLLNRKHQPEAYRLFLELISRCSLSFEAIKTQSSREKIVKSVDAALRLSYSYGIHIMELGHALVLFLYNIVVSLMDCTLDDWGLQVPSDGTSVISRSQGIQRMDIDCKDYPNGRRSERHEQIRTRNSLMALEVLTNITDSRQAVALLRLVHLNMPKNFDGLLQRLKFLEAHTKLSSVDSNHTKQIVVRLSTNMQKVLSSGCQISRRRFIGIPAGIRSYKSMPYSSSDALSASWVSFDNYMEIAMDEKELPVTSSIDILAEAIITLKILNGASWEETFLALWLSALRLVQRDRDPPEGPIPHLEPRLCLLLCIVPLAIGKVLKDDVDMDITFTKETLDGHRIDEKNLGLPRYGLISSLQILGQFSGLLCPPRAVADAANIAVAKAATFVSNTRNGMGGGFQGNSLIESGGNMRHLIVEACIARSLIDTSVYFWPGYVPTSIMSSSDSSPKQISPWNLFMEGAALSGSLISSLIMTPATSVAEVEKVYYIALNGTEEEKSAAGKILCGASLTRGWHIQEHVVNFVLKLLSPPVSNGNDGMQAYVLSHRSMLSAVLLGASYIDTVHILTLHGVVPEIAASLMPLCEAFGSINPLSTTSINADGPSIYMVFSAAFLFLLRLWKFYRPPFERYSAGGAFIGPELTLEYLLLLHNSRISPASDTSAAHFEMGSSDRELGSVSNMIMYIDYYPKLKSWYCQNKICVSSTLSGVCSGHPVHQVANKILSMIYSKMNKSTTSSGNSPSPSSSSMCGSSQSAGEEAYQRPMLPAWEILESIPIVLEAILTACAHGRLSSRDLTTGLRDLVDFLPASLAAIISYFSAEISRGIWKPVPMNGTDWPSPALMLQTVESEIKEILAGTGVHMPSCSSALTPMLPLPMAALIGLTITFKLDKSLEYIQAVAGPALESCACSCPWPSMVIVGSLWAQKVRRWHDYIVFSTSRSLFRQNKEAVAQLLRSCFTSFIGPRYGSKSMVAKQSSVNGLLGSTISALGVLPSIAPGLLYLRSCRTLQNFEYLNDVILGLVAEHSCEAASTWAETTSLCLKSNRLSLCDATARVKEVAALGASLICAAGGPQLVQELYQETVPTWLLSAREDKLGDVSAGLRVSQGYAIAYFVFISGAFVWGIREKPASWAVPLRPRSVGIQMKFLAGVLQGNTSLGCHPATWKAYVSCFIGLIVNFAPAWVREVKRDTLMKLVSGLRGLHEFELALALLECGGIAAMGQLAELLTTIC